ncbi:MAG: AraC family transcriptional regulator [Bacteroidaceae bacterium]|nr:AraC family transcriptional regulator [Bacteroidaceae bacterium]
MDFDINNIIIEDNLNGLLEKRLSDYVGHFYCSNGSCEIMFNEKAEAFSKGDCMIIVVPSMISGIKPTEDFQVKAIYTSHPFLESCAPRNNHAIKGTLALYIDPIWHLTEKEKHICERNFQQVEERLAETDHAYHRDLMISVVQTFFLDFYNFQVRIFGKSNIQEHKASIMLRFIQMLQEGVYREHRKVSYFADKLCVTPKYLSEVSKKTSGFSANYWINRFTVIEINRLLKDRSLTFAEISEQLNFSSPAYFTHYVQTYLGDSPSAHRQ